MDELKEFRKDIKKIKELIENNEFGELELIEHLQKFEERYIANSNNPEYIKALRSEIGMLDMEMIRNGKDNLKAGNNIVGVRRVLSSYLKRMVEILEKN